MHRHSTINLLLSGVVLVLGGCTERVGGQRAASRDPGGPSSVITADGGAPDVRAVADLGERGDAPLSVAIECTVGFDPFVCGGGCPSGQGCCITGVRPLGICRDLDGCHDQCEWDCGVAAVMHGTQAALQCEALCTWRAPEPHCEVPL